MSAADVMSQCNRCELNETFWSLFSIMLLLCMLTYAGGELPDSAKEKDGILSLQLLESKVDHSVHLGSAACFHCYICL